MNITKRDGHTEEFDLKKIIEAMRKAFTSVERDVDDIMLNIMALRTVSKAQDIVKELSVEAIQDCVEAVLMECGFSDVAKSYVLYRQKRANIRNMTLDVDKVVKEYIGQEDWRVKENSTVSYSVGGFILSNSGAVTSRYWLNHFYDEEIEKAHRECDIHIHDLSMLSGYCFTGNTKVKTLDGKSITFKKMVEKGIKELYLWSFDNDKKIFVKSIGVNPRITRFVNQIKQITFIGDEDIIQCTLDHPFLLEDGTYCRADELGPGKHVVKMDKDGKQSKFIIYSNLTITLQEKIPVYDLTVPNYHNFVLDNGAVVHNCAGWSLKQLILEGLGGVKKRITSNPAKHLHTLCNQMVNFLGIMQNEWAGAQAFSSFDTYLSAFVKADNLDYHTVKQCIQSFVFGVNTPSRWGCVDTETEVLSTTGFKKYNELKEGDLIYTWKDGNLEINPVNAVVIKEHKGKMHSYRFGHYHQFVTPDHRMLVTKRNSYDFHIRLSEEVFNSATPYVLPTSFDGYNIDEELNLSDEWIQLAAIVYADGSIDMRNGSVHKVKIYKSPNRYGNELIFDLTKKLGLDFNFSTQNGGFDSPVNVYTFYGDNARAIVKVVGETKKYIDEKFLHMNREQSELFLYTWSNFDGSEEKYMIQCDNEEILDQIQHIGVRAGYTSYDIRRNKTIYAKMKKSKCIYDYNRNEYDYDGLVWCPNVENGTAVFRKDGSIFISGQCQAPFSNITLDWTCPEDLKDMPAIVGGQPQDFTYGDCDKERAMVNKAFLEVMIEGDANGRGHQYPIPTYSITKDFDWSESENLKLLFDMTAKYGTPYFSNYVNSDMNPSDIRSIDKLVDLKPL